MQIIRVNRIPFRQEKGHAPSQSYKCPPIHLYNPDPAHPIICLGKLENGMLKDTPIPLPLDGEGTAQAYPHMSDGSRTASNFIHFKQGNNDEPIIGINDCAENSYDLYIDTGAAADLVPKHLLNLNFPGWRNHRVPSQTKLLAANDTEIPHEGKAKITIPLPGLRGQQVIQITPFIVTAPTEATTIIIGYSTMKAYGLVPIPGSGLLCTGKRLGQPSGPSLITAIKTVEVKDIKEAWTAHPSKATHIKPHKRTVIVLVPKQVPENVLNDNNGSQVLVRECPCILTSECEQCIRSHNRVQMCKVLNGRVDYTVDNTHSAISYTVTPKDKFYISFENVFSMGELAEAALEQLPYCEFEIDKPINPYNDQECNDLFQKTREEVTSSLRGILAEPESYSIEGLRPATLRLVDCNGMEQPPEVQYRSEEEAIPIEVFDKLNPCAKCKLKNSHFCNLETHDCELRKYLRYKALPDVSTSKLIHHDKPFSPTLLPNMATLTVGCARPINRHSHTWESWFENKVPAHRHHHIMLQHLNDAVVTEVSKANLLEIARQASNLKVTNIYFSNYRAYGTSEDLLLRCIPQGINLNIYNSTDIEVAGPAHDPRKKGSRQPVANDPSPRRNATGCSEASKKASSGPAAARTPHLPSPHSSVIPIHTRIPPEETILLTPGLPKPITAITPDKSNTGVTILTEDKDLRNRCETMLEAHKEIFSTSPSDCGQFKDPISGEPYYFQVRLKGLPPPRQKTRFVSPAKVTAATQLVSALLANGIVKRRFSNYNSQSVYVAKKRKILTLDEHIKRGHNPSSFVEGTPDPEAPLQLRHCLDLTEVNKNVVEDNLGTMSPKQLLQRLSGTFSAASLDLANAYHSLSLSKSTELVTGWETGVPSLPSRLVYTRATMGLCSSAKWLEIALTKTLSKATNKYIRYCDDVLVIGKTDEEVLNNLSSVLDLLIQYGWKIKREKLTIFAKELIVFGLKIDLTNQRISVPRADLDAILLRTRPSSAAELKSFLGNVAWWGENLGQHAEATGILHKLTRKDTPFTWTEENLKAYEKLQEFMSKPTMHISLPNHDLPFHLVSDSSEHATGCLLLQVASPTDLRIISYRSHIHDLRTSRLSSYERECYAMIYCVTLFYDIIAHRPCTIYSDSQASVLLTMMSKTNSKISRWICLLRGIPFLRISWISSKTPILKLCDYLSRRPATARHWKNRQVDSQDLERVSLAAAKLKRDTEMTLSHHDILMEYVCSLPSETLEQIYDESIFIDDNGNVRITEKSDETKLQHAQCSTAHPTVPAGPPSSLAHPEHPAFGRKQADILGSDLPEESEDAVQSKPHQVHGPDTESGPVQIPEGNEIFIGRIQMTGLNKPVTLPGNTYHPDRKMIVGEGRLTNISQPAEDYINSAPPYRAMTHPTEVIVPAHSSVFRIKAAQFKNNLGDPSIFPDNLLTMEEADELGLLDPATQCKEGPKTVGPTWDQPDVPEENDKIGKFLSLCFAKSPFMRLSALEASQNNDPKLRELRQSCKNGPIRKGEASFLLKQGILLRLHTKDRLENLQICLDKSSGYMLCLKAHLGSGTSTWRHSRGLPLHHGAKKMYNLVSSRFYFDNMYDLCKQIVATCFICSEGKHNVATTRADAHKRMVTATVPGEMWSCDLLELPGTGSANVKLLTGLDLFSNFGIAIVLTQAPTAAYLFDVILWNIFAAYGRPRCFIFDNASYFRSQALKEAMTQLNCELRTIPAYSAKSSPVEALNKLIIKHLRLLHMHYSIPHSHWRSSLPHIMTALNFSPYSGTMGQLHKLSPARVFFGDTRQSLDPSARFDLPFLEHRFTSHAEFVRRTANANWAIQQLVAEHKEALQKARLKTNLETNARFDNIRTYRLGDVILFDRKLPPGVASKLRPRATYRFVVVGETASSVYVRPWSSGSLDRWASAQKFTKQSKDAAVLLPLIKLPKERTRKDTSLHLFSNNSRVPERQLLKNMAHEDPEKFEVEIEELREPDWISSNEEQASFEESAFLEEPTPDSQENVQFEDEPPEVTTDQLHSLITDSNLAALRAPARANPNQGSQPTLHPDPASRRQSRRTGPIGARNKNLRSIIKDKNLRRSKRHAKSCKFSSRVSYDDGSEGQLHTGPSAPFRIFKFSSSTDNPMENLDKIFAGEFHRTPKGLVHIQYPNNFDRKCACAKCTRQLPGCRTTPCPACKVITNNDGPEYNDLV